MPTSDFTPDTADVAAIMWARTADEHGETGSFDDDTRPTAATVEAIIDQAADYVAARTSEDLPDRLHSLAQQAVGYRVAMIVENSFYPEQAENQDSAYERYRALFEDALQALLGEYRDGIGSVQRAVMSVPLVSPLTAFVDEEDDDE